MLSILNANVAIVVFSYTIFLLIASFSGSVSGFNFLFGLLCSITRPICMCKVDFVMEHSWSFRVSKMGHGPYVLPEHSWSSDAIICS